MLLPLNKQPDMLQIFRSSHLENNKHDTEPCSTNLHGKMRILTIEPGNGSVKNVSSTDELVGHILKYTLRRSEGGTEGGFRARCCRVVKQHIYELNEACCSHNRNSHVWNSKFVVHMSTV